MIGVLLRLSGMAQKFPYERASSILAEAELWGDDAVCKRWNITRQTLWNYRNRASEDGKLLQSFTLKKRMLLMGWQQDATECLRVGLQDLKRRIPIASTEIDSKLIYSIAGAMKVIGELKITADTLTEAPGEIDPVECEL